MKTRKTNIREKSVGFNTSIIYSICIVNNLFKYLYILLCYDYRLDKIEY